MPRHARAASGQAIAAQADEEGEFFAVFAIIIGPFDGIEGRMGDGLGFPSEGIAPASSTPTS